MLQTIKIFFLISALMIIPQQTYAQAAESAVNGLDENVQETISDAKEEAKLRQKKSRSGPATLVRAAQASVDPDIYEPDNNNIDATFIEVNSTQSGYSITPGDEDWVVFFLEQATSIQLATNGTSGDTYLQLYNENLDEIAANDDHNNPFSLIYYCNDFPLDAGLYYARVTEFNPDGAIDDYTISLSTEDYCSNIPSEGEPDMYEPDDDMDTASYMDLDSIQHGHSITPVGDEDWVYFFVDEPTMIYLETFGGYGDTQLWLYDELLNEIAYNDDTDYTNFASLVHCVSAGVYYARVTEYYSDELIDDYAIAISAGGPCDSRQDIYETDNDSNTATYMEMDSFQDAHSIIPGDDEDWVYFFVDEPSMVYLDTYGDNGDTELWLYDEGLNEIGYNDDNDYGLYSTLIIECLAPGLYYAKVTELGQQEIDDYSLSLSSGDCQNNSLYFSSSTSGRAGGVGFADEDIMAFDPVSEQWSRHFDGSDVGLQSRDVDAFHIQKNGNILLSVNAPVTLDGTRFDDSDIIEFIPSSLGNRTSGNFYMYLDGSDVDLTTGAEDIDAITLLSNGDLIISTLGTARVAGAVARDEDLLRFTPRRLGNWTRGAWSLYMDSSDIGLSNAYEDIWALWIDETFNETHMSTYRDYNISDLGVNLQGDSDDIFIGNCTRGIRTACDLYYHWDGDSYGFGSELVDGYSVGPVPLAGVLSAAIDEADDADSQPEDENDSADDILDDDEYTEHLYLPLIVR